VSGFWTPPDDYAYDLPIIQGGAHSVSSEAPERDRVEDLRRTVEEVTRKPLPRPVKRMGFY
jgi:hypothetical protein